MCLKESVRLCIREHVCVCLCSQAFDALKETLLVALLSDRKLKRSSSSSPLQQFPPSALSPAYMSVCLSVLSGHRCLERDLPGGAAA